MTGPYFSVLPLRGPGRRWPQDRVDWRKTRRGHLRLPDRAAPATVKPPGQFGFEASIIAGTATIVLSGDLDLTVTPSLSWLLAQVLKQKPRQVLFDMAGVDFLDCAAAQLIVSMDGLLPEGQQPVIQYPSYAVRRILKLTGLDTCCSVAT